MPDEQKKEVRKLIKEEWEKAKDNQLAPQVKACADACVEDPNAGKSVDCLLKAKTAKAADDCL